MMSTNTYMELLNQANSELDKLANTNDTKIVYDVLSNVKSIADKINGTKTEDFTIDDLDRLWIGE